jgi:hypothetical protein
MSRIFEALKRAQLSRAGKSDSLTSSVTEKPQPPERRKSRRFAEDVAVYVYGYGPGTEPFHEEAHTLNVSESGALLLLSVPVQKGQILLLTNLLTQREQDCRVVFLGAQHSRTVETGVAFPGTNSDFWQTHVPPEDQPAA